MLSTLKCPEGVLGQCAMARLLGMLSENSICHRWILSVCVQAILLLLQGPCSGQVLRQLHSSQLGTLPLAHLSRLLSPHLLRPLVRRPQASMQAPHQRLGPPQPSGDPQALRQPLGPCQPLVRSQRRRLGRSQRRPLELSQRRPLEELLQLPLPQALPLEVLLKFP